MALLEDVAKMEGAGPVVLGIGALMLAPTLLPALGRALRPVVKGVIKTGMTIYDETYASMREATGDLIEEARAELRHEAQSHNGQAHGGMSAEGQRGHAHA
ncbi:DUF5132 domain-containing protein [Methylocystis parvus]|uniref:DUF5132 domain-containing protein n=1 Tax=Methylocystis parvus TaxID=134 RepID=A0A6B8M795_9HYPH|nr:DUF5132 domain-containing protein [Methylocystis parvus]QGM97872.1 DUF5132 domain-containing protein [Methylocystis parvus]WBK01819.1 DUF5132 domain-containing protein [Methylocystis parvus OBBP]